MHCLEYHLELFAKLSAKKNGAIGDQESELMVLLMERVGCLLISFLCEKRVGGGRSLKSEVTLPLGPTPVQAPPRASRGTKPTIEGL